MSNRLNGHDTSSGPYPRHQGSDPIVRDMGTARPGEWKQKPQGVREVHHYAVGARKRSHTTSKPAVRERISSGALVAAGLLIAFGIVGGAWVVYDAQYRFALSHNWGNEDIAHIQAAIPEVVWVGMALLGLAQALRGRKSARATSGIVLFFSLSMGAQLLYAVPNPGGYLVAIITPLALALLLETFIDGVYRWSLAKDGIDVEEKPILLRIGAALGTVPKLLWLLPAALLIGFLLDFTATWTGVRTWLLETALPLAPFVLLIYPAMWLLRLWLDKEGTKTGMRTWLLDMIPYAPGRTKAQDDARAAQRDARQAEQNQAEAERLAEKRVQEEKRRADEALTDAHQAHTEELERLRADFAADQRAAQEAAAEREQTLIRERDQQVAEIQAQLHRMESSSDAGLRQAKARAETQLSEARAEFEQALAGERRAAEKQARELREVYERRLSAAQEELTAARGESSRLSEQVRSRTARVDELNGQVETLLQTVSGRERLLWEYQVLGRQGDVRFGRRDYVREVVRELLQTGDIPLQSENTACNYVTDWLDKNPAAVNGQKVAVRS